MDPSWEFQVKFSRRLGVSLSEVNNRYESKFKMVNLLFMCYFMDVLRLPNLLTSTTWEVEQPLRKKTEQMSFSTLTWRVGKGRE